MTAHLTLLLATTNRGKLAELRALLADLPVELVSLATALPDRPQAVEDGATFEDNALIKARAAASAAMLVTLAEDAGLEVDAIGGRPGVRSARFSSLSLVLSWPTTTTPSARDACSMSRCVTCARLRNRSSIVWTGT